MRHFSTARLSSFTALFCLLVLKVQFAFAKPKVAPESKGPLLESFHQGVVVSCPRFGQVWGGPQMDSTIEEVGRLGVNAIQIHPYASINRKGQVGHRGETPIEAVKEGILKIKRSSKVAFLKPHLSYWGQFSWRGEITFQTAKEWDEFFNSYTAYIVKMAKLAQQTKVDLFAIGTELKGTLHHTERWKKIISLVRKEYKGRILYAANWDSVSKVKFWPLLDAIGVQFYYPLTSAAEGQSKTKSPTPDAKAIRSALMKPVKSLKELSLKTGKPVFFAEVGYARTSQMLEEPWKSGLQSSKKIMELRRKVVAEVLKIADENKKWLQGMYWWKWMPGNSDRHHSDFSVKDIEVSEELLRQWGKPKNRP